VSRRPGGDSGRVDDRFAEPARCLQARAKGIQSVVPSREADNASSAPPSADGAIGEWVVDHVKDAKLTTVLGVGAVIGAVAGAATAMRSRSDDVISGQVSIDLLKKVELLTIRLRLHRS
jgi:hypothetical protein